MKKIYFSLVTFLFLAVANAQIVNIPDPVFKARLLSANSVNGVASVFLPDSDGNITWNAIDLNFDGEIQVSEAETIKYLNVSNSYLTNLEGIKSFTNLQSLNCELNLISNIDVSGLSELIFLNCYNNFATNINLYGLYNLINLDCSINQLEELNLVGLQNLEVINFSNNLIDNVNLNDATNLKELYCSNNQLQTLNVSNLISLQELSCSDNQLQTLNLIGLTNMERLFCGQNPLTSLYIINLLNLNTLSFINTQLTNVDLDGLINLKFIYCPYNQLQTLDINELTNLTYLDCSYNQLQIIDAINLQNLNVLYCNDNLLTSLFIKNINPIWQQIHYHNNPDISYICVDTGYINFIIETNSIFGYTNCTVDSNCNLSIETNTYDDNYFTIYPNPVDEVLNLNTKQDTEIYSLTVYNLLGQQVQTTTNPNNTVDVSSLKTGNYIVKVLTDKGVSSSKFVKE